MPRSHTWVIIFVFGIGLACVGGPEAEAQSQRSQQVPAQQRAAPGSGGAPVGTEGPAATRPSNPQSSLGQSPSGATPSDGAQTQAPTAPSDPSQVPLGGAEWVAAAGAAYALNRVRKDASEGGDDEEE